jgi:threonine dehydratase
MATQTGSLPISLQQILAARDVIAGRVHRTPMLSSATAARVVAAATGARIGDGRVHLKSEHLQKTGSFKVRGALARIAGLGEAERERGVITLSAGNAAAAYAWAGAQFGVPVVVVMPARAVPAKVEACRGYGAEVVLFGAHTGESYDHMLELEAARGLTYVSPFDDVDVIAGAGTVGLEILDDLPEVDVIVAGIGGGGLVSGTATAIRSQRPSVRVYGVEPEGANTMALAIARGEIVRIQPSTVADGLAAPFAGTNTSALVRHYAEDVVVIPDAVIRAGLRFILERTKQVVEPAGAAALGALLTGAIPIRDDERVCVVLSGGNVEIARLGELIQGAAELPA